MTWRAVLRHRGGRVGAAIALLVVVFAVVGPWLTAFDPDLPDYANQLAAPDATHWLGTDNAGRDQFARTVAGTATSLTAVLTVFVLTTGIGLIVGGAAGYVRGAVDAVISRVIDAALGLPSQIVALAVVGALGVGQANLVLAIVISGWAYPARIARATVLGSHQRLDVIAARMAGIGRTRVFLGHVLPGMLATVLVSATTTIGEVVLTLAGLSFLGLGAQPPTAELGQMLADSQASLVSSPWLLIGPTTVIAMIVAAAILVSDAVRDVLDPLRPIGKDRRRGRPTARPSGGVLALSGLTVTYPDGTEAVLGVDLTVREGECLAIVGESGCGKTTLVRTVLDLLPVGSTVDGEVTVDGVSVLGLGERARRRLRGLVVGYVAQDPYAACDPLRSVRHHVAEAWRNHRTRPADGEVAKRVAALGVDRAASRLRERPHQWSGGMLQRATIAASAVHRPVLTIADEPTSALDTHLADDVLITLRANAGTLLVISHDLRLVARHSDRIAVMSAGRIVEIGPAAEILGSPQHPYTRTLLAAGERRRAVTS